VGAKLTAGCLADGSALQLERDAFNIRIATSFAVRGSGWPDNTALISQLVRVGAAATAAELEKT
jgi:hypothetical protein